MGQSTFESPPKSYMASAAITANRVVKLHTTAGQIAISAGATDVCVGVTLHAAAANSAVDVFDNHGGIVEVEAGAAVALAAIVQSNGDGTVKTAVGTGYPLGQAIEAATAAGDLIKIRWCPSLTVKA